MQHIVNQLNSIWGGVSSISSSSHRNRVSLLLDFTYCFLRYGCLPRQFLIGGFWNKTENDRADILTYRHFVKMIDGLNDKNEIHTLQNKAHFNRFFDDLVSREWILSTEASMSQIESFVSKHGQVIVKPLSAQEGEGIYCLSASELTPDKAEALAAKPFMIEEILKQHPRMVFGNRSVNTIRLHTLIDKNGCCIPFSPVLRVGIGDSIMDNYCAGGVIYPVDVESGMVIDTGNTRQQRNIAVHPGTDTVMLGFRIPNWDILIKQVTAAALRLPNLRLIGWDVAITENGVALIEGNHNPDYELTEFIGKGKMWKQLKTKI